jgi:peptidoglycan/xylan/chitin deacetylase (PgdA/CDA1 family)
MRASTSRPGSSRRTPTAAPATATIAVLAYHRVGPPPLGSWETWFLVSRETLRDHLRLLHDRGWEVISLSRLVAGLDGGQALPERAALLTFDDGFAATARSLPGCLDGLPAVAFVPTDYIGSANGWNAETAEPREPICGIAELRALERAGVTVQSHAASHRGFSTLDSDEREDELGRSKRALERGLTKTVEALAYPYGDPGPDREALDAALARIGYRLAFVYGGAPVRLAEADRFRFPRIAVGPDTDLEEELELP